MAIYAQFLDASAVGGIEKHVALLAKQLNQIPEHSAIVFLWRNHESTELNRLFSELRIPVIYLEGSLFYFLKMLRHYQVSMIHTHGYKANILGRMIAKFIGLACVSTHHNGDAGEGIVVMYTMFDRLTARLGLSTNIVVSDEIQRNSRFPSIMVNNFVSIPTRPAEPLPDHVGFVGRLHPVKRVDRFISLAHKFPQLVFDVFGDGSDFMSAKKSSSKNVKLHGFVQQTEEIWSKIDVLVICSDYEGLPLAALEAMSFGIPVISLKLGQLTTVIQHEVNGFLADDMNSLVRWLTAWQKMPISAQQTIRFNARKTVIQQYGVEENVEQVCKIYRNALTPKISVEVL